MGVVGWGCFPRSSFPAVRTTVLLGPWVEREEALGGRRGHYGVLPAGARTKARTPSH